VTDLHVVDPDLEGALSSTERNAGGIRHLWQNRINVELARPTIALCDRMASTVGFQRTGYLWLYSKESAEEGRGALRKTKEFGVPYEELSVADIRKKVPFIDQTDDLAFGLFGPRDGIINSNALKTYYRSEAKKRGVTFHDRLWVEKLSESGGEAHVQLSRLTDEAEAEKRLRQPARGTASETWDCKCAVLSAGAWTRNLLQGLVPDPKIQPVRRQMSLFKAEALDLSPYGMIVDTSRVYFHPEGGNIVAGLVLKDEKPGFRFDYDCDFFESHIWPALYARSSQMERLKPISGWGGLYSYTPDTSGILGKVPGHETLYEAHSFTGRGVMQSYGAAIALSELIIEKRFRSIDAAALTRQRFDGPESQWLKEGLHI
jgi:glycine/D-amino acid oxidase-like deaminating enzyme